MVSNSAQLNRRTKQHTQFGVSASNGSRDMARTKSWQKKRKKTNEANWVVSNSAKLDRRIKQHTQFGVSASNGSRDSLWPGQNLGEKKKKKIKNNEVNWMVSNSAKLDHNQAAHSIRSLASNGSRDSLWPGQNLGEKRLKKKKRTKRIGW